MAKVGRPTMYKPEYADQAKKLCTLGATNKQLADFFEVSGTTIDNWIKEHPEFIGAIKKGRLEADTKVADSLYHRAIGYQHQEDKIFNNGCDSEGNPRDPLIVPTTKHYPPDTAAAIFWLKNRQPDVWRDKQEIQQDTTITVNIVEFSPDGEDT